MLDLLFRCSGGCLNAPSVSDFPLCAGCRESLIRCPPLCPVCAGLRCAPDLCSHPWLAPPKDVPIRSFSAYYLLVGGGFRVLKRWKTGSGPVLERRILPKTSSRPPRFAWSSRLLDREAWEIIPVGQDPRRAWKLGGSPAERVSHWLARQTGLRANLGLRAEPRKSRQAESDQWGRLIRPPRFSATREIRPRIILVDDFMTTGRTIEAAARVLARAGAIEIHVFSLGFRPRRDLREARLPIRLQNLPPRSSQSA